MRAGCTAHTTESLSHALVRAFGFQVTSLRSGGVASSVHYWLGKNATKVSSELLATNPIPFSLKAQSWLLQRLAPTRDLRGAPIESENRSPI